MEVINHPVHAHFLWFRPRKRGDSVVGGYWGGVLALQPSTSGQQVE
ncbi:MAG: hypothetical protein H6673_14745 [Anaerolineales bacterium]|nr:hypothetical protein [Anaerolineales bacterium]